MIIREMSFVFNNSTKHSEFFHLCSGVILNEFLYDMIQKHVRFIDYFLIKITHAKIKAIMQLVVELEKSKKICAIKDEL